MIVEDAVARLMLPVAYGIAVVVVLLMLAHVARRYGSSPKRVPAGIGYDGRPAGNVPKLCLWLGPAIITIVLVVVGVAMVFDPPADYKRPVLTLTMIALAEVAGLVVWITDRQIEFARKQTYRIAPARLIRTFLPLLATIAVLVVVGVRTGP
jgi:hypothetical protein